MPSNHLILSSPSPPICNLSQHQGLFNESVLHIKWPKYWSFSFSISPSNEYSGLISFRMDWLDLLAVQGILKSLLQHHSFSIRLDIWLTWGWFDTSILCANIISLNFPKWELLKILKVRQNLLKLKLILWKLKYWKWEKRYAPLKFWSMLWSFPHLRESYPLSMIPTDHEGALFTHTLTPALGSVSPFFFLRFFSIHTIFKVSSEFVTILLLFYVLVLWPWGIVHHSSTVKDQIQSPCTRRRSLNHWIQTCQLREVPELSIIFAALINKKQRHLISEVRVISLGKRNQPCPHRLGCRFQGRGSKEPTNSLSVILL